MALGPPLASFSIFDSSFKLGIALSVRLDEATDVSGLDSTKSSTGWFKNIKIKSGTMKLATHTFSKEGLGSYERTHVDACVNAGEDPVMKKASAFLASSSSENANAKEWALNFELLVPSSNQKITSKVCHAWSETLLLPGNRNSS